MLSKYKVLIAVTLLAGTAFYVQAERLQSATDRAAYAEASAENLSNELESLQSNFDSVVNDLQAERALNSRLTVTQNELYRTIDVKTKRLEHALKDLSKKDEAIRNWTRVDVPRDVVRLLKRASNNCENGTTNNSNRASGESSPGLPETNCSRSNDKRRLSFVDPRIRTFAD